MKKLLPILFLLVSMPLFAQGLPARLHIPELYRDYKSKGRELGARVRYIGSDALWEKTYDIDGDNLRDVTELYQITDFDNGRRLVYHPENPIIYIFDFNGNHEEDSGEILMDPDIDGLNGNETWYNPNSKPVTAA